MCHVFSEAGTEASNSTMYTFICASWTKCGEHHVALLTSDVQLHFSNEIQFPD